MMRDWRKMKKRYLILMMFAAVMTLLASTANAYDFEIGGKEGSIMGYLNQSIGWNISGGSHYDTPEGFQSAVFQLLLEAKLNLSPQLRIFGSLNFNSDWAYELLDEKDDWEDRQFDKSRDELYMLHNMEDVLKELHVTWTPGNLMFRVGKQVVVWGEMNVTKIMDQINPVDQRRGISDIEFEKTVIPLWLFRAEYFMIPDTDWMTELGFQFIFNPNLNFRGNQSPTPGGDAFGIWAPNVTTPLGGPYPMDFAHIGSYDIMRLEEPDVLDSDGFEYGFRIRTVLWDAIITLNYLDGISNTTVMQDVGPPRMEFSSAFDGRLIIHPSQAGFYPDQKILGGTFSRDLEWLYILSLGGVAPVVRAEVAYAMDSTFVGQNRFEEYDELWWGVGIDWKIKVGWLNPRAYFSLSGQFILQKILDYPDYNLTVSGLNGPKVEENRQSTSLLVKTSYFHNKLEPKITWARNWTAEADLLKFDLLYEKDHHWEYTLGAVFFSGNNVGEGFHVFRNKDHLVFTVAYRF